MFAVYQKIISPASSPVLGPVSPNLAPTNVNVNVNNVNVNNANVNVNVNNANANANANTNANANANANNIMESLSLCNYCCSPRTKQKHDKHDDAPIQIQAQDKAAQDKAAQDKAAQAKAAQDKAAQEDPIQCPIKPKYEFGHATHYVYGVTNPRLLCEFE